MRAKIQFHQLVLGAGVCMLVACHASVPVAQTMLPAKPDSAVLLSQQSVDATIYQYASAEVHRLYQQGYELARIRLDENLERPHVLPPAVIVDIDETVLDNSPSNVTDIVQGRTFSPVEWKKWTAMASAKAVPGAVEFLNYAAGKGCAIFYISNREMDEKAATIKNLQAVGFPMADEAHVMPMGSTSDKTERRAEVAKDHYIALLIGDQLSDFDQSFKDRSSDLGKPHVDEMRDTLGRYFILLPNSIYGPWLNAVAGRSDPLKLESKERFLQQNAY